MELTNEFRVDADPATTWQVLTDLERIAPCLPGAQLQEVEGEEYRGTVKVKVGPITAQYKGIAKLVVQDEDELRAVVEANGRDTRGQGNASATISATLTPDGTGTKVAVATDLTITGKVAQFGRGVMADVSSKLLDQFVEALEGTVLQGAADVAAPASAAPAASDDAPPEAPPALRRIQSAPAEPVNLVQLAGKPVAVRAGVLAAGLVAVVLLLRRLSRSSRRRPR